VRLQDEAGSSLKREDERMKRFVAVDEVRKIRERAESERLLFVAWTRAKDKLILVGTESEGQKKQNQKAVGQTGFNSSPILCKCLWARSVMSLSMLTAFRFG
jgi:hypothetical protein